MLKASPPSDTAAGPCSTPEPADARTWSALWPALGLLIPGLLALGLATVLADGVEGQFVVIAAPFGPSTLEIVAKADGALVASGGFANVMIAASDRPGFAADLRQAGALAVFAAPRFLGCTSPSETGS